MSQNVELNPEVVLREEFDDWAVLFDPQTGSGFGLNPVGVFVWKHLDGHHSIQEIRTKLSDAFDEVPGDVEEHLGELIQSLVDKGLAGYVIKENQNRSL